VFMQYFGAGQTDDRCLPTSPTQQLIAQQQLLQSANVQHVAAMAALENMHNQAKARVSLGPYC